MAIMAVRVQVPPRVQRESQGFIALAFFIQHNIGSTIHFQTLTFCLTLIDAI